MLEWMVLTEQCIAVSTRLMSALSSALSAWTLTSGAGAGADFGTCEGIGLSCLGKLLGPYVALRARKSADLHRSPNECRNHVIPRTLGSFAKISLAAWCCSLVWPGLRDIMDQSGCGASVSPLSGSIHIPVVEPWPIASSTLPLGISSFSMRYSASSGRQYLPARQ